MAVQAEEIKRRVFSNFDYFRVNGLNIDSYAVKHMKDIILESEDLYPGIDIWYKKQVEPGIYDKSRIGYIVYNNNKPIAGMIIRLSNRAKLCSLRVIPEARNMGIGTALFELAAYEISKIYTQFHFTAPESLVEQAKDYFLRIGFEYAGVVNRQYRPGEGEFAFIGDVNKVLGNINNYFEHSLIGQKTSTKQNESAWLVMSIKPKFAHKIMEKEKRIELRRQFSPSHKGSSVLIYSTSPQQAILGFARIEDISQVPISMIENELLADTGCELSEVYSYAFGVESIWALVLGNVQPFPKPLHKKDLESVLKLSLKPPVSYEHVKTSSPWKKVIDYVSFGDFLDDLSINCEREDCIESYKHSSQGTFW